MVEKPRVALYDNVKFFCMVAVVTGHFIEEFVGQSGVFKSLFLLIYSFHVPLFFFISGLFQKQFNQSSKFPWRRITFFVLVSYMMKILSFLIRNSSSRRIAVNWFGGHEPPWFLMVLTFYIVIVYAIRKIKVHPVIIVGISMLLGCLCGYFTFIHDFLWLSRFLVFMPFYVSGYYLTPERLHRLIRNPAIRISSILLSLFYGILCFCERDVCYSLRGLFTGRNPYSSVTAIPDCSVLHRLLCYFISVVLCLGILSAMPDREFHFLPGLGKNSLSAYFWHVPILCLMDRFFYGTKILVLPHQLWVTAVFLFSVILAALLMTNVCAVPSQKFQTWVLQWSEKLCMIVLSGLMLAGVVFTCMEGIII